MAVPRRRRSRCPAELRFSDLRASVVGIPPNVLSQRLKSLVAEGLVTTRDLPPPAARTVYAATEAGMATRPILRALVRFGVDRLGPADAGTRIPPASAVATAVTSWFVDDVTAAAEDYRLVVDGEAFDLSSRRGGPSPVSGPCHPAVTVTVPGWVLLNVRTGETAWDDAVATGDMTVAGSAAATKRFRRVFQFAE